MNEGLCPDCRELLKAQDNSWAQVWGKWSKHPGLMAVGEEWRGKDGTYLAACALNDWIGRLLKEVEECASA